MQAINSPTPDPPITFTPLSPIDEKSSSRLTRWWPIALALLVGLVSGFAVGRPPASIPPPSSIVVAPDLQTTLGWMFDAALGHEAVDETGAVAAPASPGIKVESVEILDAATGPIVVVVSSPDGGLGVYEVTVERDRLNWQVKASRLSIDG